MHFAFLGNYNVNHNCDGVGWFAREVFPHILKRLPDAEFHILGMHAERVFTVPPGGPIKVRGYVRDVEEALQEYRVFVCPLTYGAGMKGKLGSAAAAGLPFVTTSIGAEGMPLEDGVNCFIADDPEEFALKCVHLHRDPVAWWNFSLKSRRMIAGQARIRSVSEQLLELVQGLVSGRKSLGAENVAV
jgi:glycosyltransferase involved in cell wall biosynthesis